MTRQVVATAEAFAAALDGGDWAGAQRLLSETCEYVFRGGRISGPTAIIALYRDIGEWVQSTFDEVRYDSRVELAADGRARIQFRDHMSHGPRTLDFRCEQWLRLDADERIVHIEHVDLPGEREKADAFNEACGVARPGQTPE